MLDTTVQYQLNKPSFRDDMSTKRNRQAGRVVLLTKTCIYLGQSLLNAKEKPDVLFCGREKHAHVHMVTILGELLSTRVSICALFGVPYAQVHDVALLCMCLCT